MAKTSQNKDQEIITQLGERIKSIRQEKGMTQMDLAVEVNLDPSAIRRYEKGRVEMGFTTLIKFAEVFEMSIDDLLDIK